VSASGKDIGVAALIGIAIGAGVAALLGTGPAALGVAVSCG
jgi:hypothetical protein